MQRPLSNPSTPLAHGLLWVLSPSGWALGELLQPQPLLEQTWPQGEPPDDCPALDLGWALRQARGSQPPEAAACVLHLLVFEWPAQGRVTWWPDAPHRLQAWREVARDSRVPLHTVRLMSDELGSLSLWEAAQEAWPEARSLQRIHGWADWLPRRPWTALALSAGVCTVLNLLLLWGVRPALIEHRQQAQEQAAQAQRLAWVQQDQARAQAHEAERQTQWQVWQNRQREALVPLAQWVQWVAQADRAGSPQYWTEMRWSQGAWTVGGLASHASAWQVMRGGSLASWHIESIESTPTVWPSADPWGGPVWRFQVRLQAPPSDRTDRIEATP